MRRKRAVNRVRKVGPSGRKRKFLRKYSKGLGSADKTYAFKRLANPMVVFTTGVGGQIDTICPRPANQAPTIQWSNLTGAQQYGDVYSFDGSMLFRLQDAMVASDFTGLFEQYKISGVKLKIYWTSTESTSGSRVPAPRMTYAIDEDDVNPEGNSTIRQRNNVKFHQFSNGVPLSLYIKPRMATEVYNTTTSIGVGTTAYSAKRGWVDSLNPNVEHYGLKFHIDDVWAPAIEQGYATAFRVEATYYLKMKGVY